MSSTSQVHYTVSILTDSEIQTDEQLEIKLTGPVKSTKWVALSSDSEWKRIETFEFEEHDIDTVDEVCIRLRDLNNPGTVFDLSLVRLDLDIRGIFVTVGESKQYSFTLRDQLNEDYKTAYFLPGSLYKFEITTTKGRNGEKEKEQIPTVQVLHEQDHTVPLPLNNPIGDPFKEPFIRPGVDVFVLAGKRLPKIDGLVITNTKENYGTRWKIERIACYICHSIRNNKLVF